MSSPEPISLFYSYAWESDRDTNLLGELEAVLKPLDGLIEGWHAGQVRPGEHREDEVYLRQGRARLVLLLTSIDLLNHHQGEIERALEMQSQRQGRTLPILLRDTNLRGTLLGELRHLPWGRKPISRWRHRDEAWSQVSLAVQEAALELRGGDKPAPGDQAFVITLAVPADAVTWTTAVHLMDQLASILPKGTRCTLQQFCAGSLRLLLRAEPAAYQHLSGLWRRGVLRELGGYRVLDVRRAPGLLGRVGAWPLVLLDRLLSALRAVYEARSAPRLRFVLPAVVCATVLILVIRNHDGWRGGVDPVVLEGAPDLVGRRQGTGVSVDRSPYRCPDAGHLRDLLAADRGTLRTTWVGDDPIEFDAAFGDAHARVTIRETVDRPRCRPPVELVFHSGSQPERDALAAALRAALRERTGS